MKMNLIPQKTYATSENAFKAVEKAIDQCQWDADCRYMVVWNEEGRAYPVFVGKSAVTSGIAHFGFIVVA